jgi:hypothetical protein
MTEDRPVLNVAWPTDEQREEAFNKYALAVGKVAYAWNYLHEKLALIFVAVMDMDRQVALAVWYSTYNDRKQRAMLKAAVNAAASGHWPNSTAKDDIVWMLDRIDGACQTPKQRSPPILYLHRRRKGRRPRNGRCFLPRTPKRSETSGEKLIDRV